MNSINAVSDRLLNSRSFSLLGTGLLLICLMAIPIGSAHLEQAVVRDGPASEHISEITTSSQYSHTPPSNKSLWTCFDYSMNYSLHNPSWGMVCISPHPRFLGTNHVVNYQINYSDNTLIIHDGFLENDYAIEGWEYDSCTFDYYHFYIDSERPTRYYNRRNSLHIRPNAEEVYRDWILTR